MSPLKYFHLLRCSLLHATPVRNLLRHLHAAQGLVCPFAKLSSRLTAQLCGDKFCRCCHSLQRMISYTDTYQYISQYVCDMWQREWDTAVNNKLHATKPLIGEQPSAYRSVRRDEVVLSRLRLGHSYLTHSYLLKGEPPPECVTCNYRLTISHILVDCIEYDFFRLILFENNFTLTDIFNNVSPNKIISFIKRAGLYNTL